MSCFIGSFSSKYVFNKIIRFRGAYSLVLEKDKLPELFGEIEVTADTLSEMADGIVAASK